MTHPNICTIIHIQTYVWQGGVFVFSVTENNDIYDKLNILTDAAKYDVACTSSGVTRGGISDSIGNTAAAGICHSFSGDGRCISLLKILYTNECIYDCKYCINRRSNDTRRTSFTPEELAKLTISFYRRNYIEGLFLSSGITRSPNDTMEDIYKALLLLRHTYKFNGYIHVKTIPGTDPVLIEHIGWLADRMSINLEFPTADSLAALAPHKSRKNILTPMRYVQTRRNTDMYRHGELSSPSLSYLTDNSATDASTELSHISAHPSDALTVTELRKKRNRSVIMKAGEKRFVPAGQSTQMIIGANDDTDYEIMQVTEALYKRFELKRVFYSAFINVNHDSLLPDTDKPELLREHRLYQADWLLRYYNFTTDEILSKEHPNLNTLVDPKCSYALSHLDIFPVEIMTASYHLLLRVPGIGVTSARRIMKARSHMYGSHLTFSDLKKFGVVLKRAQYFITCGGISMIPLKINQSFILANLIGLTDKPALSGLTQNDAYEQLSLFDVSPIVESSLQTIFK